MERSTYIITNIIIIYIRINKGCNPTTTTASRVSNVVSSSNDDTIFLTIDAALTIFNTVPYLWGLIINNSGELSVKFVNNLLHCLSTEVNLILHFQFLHTPIHHDQDYS